MILNTREYYTDNDELQYLLWVMQNHAQTNQLLLNYHDNVFQVKRDDYYPNLDGVLVLKYSDIWSNSGFSVAELREILEKYHENIRSVVFDVGNDCLQRLINLYESEDRVGLVYYTVIMVGSEEDAAKPNYRPLNLANNPNIRNII